jgi:hypothetical protein
MTQSSPQRKEKLIDQHNGENTMGPATSTTTTTTTQRRSGSGSIVDTVVETAKICNSLVLDYCTLCTVYIDKQVQYELITGSVFNMPPTDTTPTGTGMMMNPDDVDYYYGQCGVGMDHRMFDEDSVVDSVQSRQ